MQTGSFWNQWRTSRRFSRDMTDERPNGHNRSLTVLVRDVDLKPVSSVVFDDFDFKHLLFFLILS